MLEMCGEFGTLPCMIVDGTSIAREIRASLKDRIKRSGRRLLLGVIVAEETNEIRTFVRLKQQFGTDIGVEVEVIELASLKKDTETLLRTMLHATKTFDGIIVQLPLPRTIDLESLLNLYPLSHDVDVLGNTAFEQYREGALPFNPPVVSAMAEVLHRNGVRLAGYRVLVLGEGRLVGAPAAIWAQRMGATVKMANNATANIDDWVRGADIIICGTGSPGVVTPDKIREGVIILDAGTSEQGGVLKGDADPSCAEKARIFTPTPGGIGPITVAKVFENLLTLVDLKDKKQV